MSERAGNFGVEETKTATNVINTLDDGKEGSDKERWMMA